MKHVLLIGAGRSVSALVDYLAKLQVSVTIIDKDKAYCDKRVEQLPNATARYFDVFDTQRTYPEIKKADLVISMLPAHLHYSVIKLCVDLKTDVLTASYVSDEVKALSSEAGNKGVKIIMECGLDPGIDHMSAMKEIDRIKELGGKVTSFRSYTGGLVAPDCDNNPWNYKISWNPRNIVLAGKGTTQFLRNNRRKYISYYNLFDRVDSVFVDGWGDFEAYANRDSLKYIDLYSLDNTATVVRGTLRRKGFAQAWSKLVKLGLTDDESYIKDMDNMTFRDFTNSFLPYSEFLSVEEKFLKFCGLDEYSPEFKKINWLGLFDRIPIGMSNVTPAQVIQKLLVDKWQLDTKDKDMVVMQHQIEYLVNDEIKSEKFSLVILGKDKEHTAMAHTVGLPLGIVAKLILENKLTELSGVVIPTVKDIYLPVIEELKEFGVNFIRQ